MKIYTFKVALDFNKRTYRNIELSGQHTLADFHNTIFDAFDRYDEHLYSFFITRKAVKNRRTRWQAPEFTIIFEDDDPFSSKEKYDVEKTKISELNLNEKDKLYYLFDFGDEWWHEVTLLSVKESKNITLKPKIVKISGESPDQYPDYEDEDFE